MKISKELKEAVIGYQSGKQEDFDKLYNLSHKYLYVCIYHLVREEDTAKDMLQETYLEISRSISQLKNVEDFLSWAAVIAKRKCYAYLNKADQFVLVKEGGDGQEIFDGIADDEAFIPESIMQDMEKRRLVREIIDGLSDMQRLCIIGYYYNEQKQEEIAEELGIPVNTVKSHLNRAKAKIKEEVLTLEKEKDTKLYALAPFMLLFFSKEVEACEAVPMSDTLMETVKAEGTDSGGAKLRKLMQLNMKVKIAVGVVAVIGIASIIGAVVFHSSSDTDVVVEEETNAPENEQIQTDNEEETDMQIEEGDTETIQADNEEDTESEEDQEDYNELAISGMYDELAQGRDGRIVVCKGEKWGLVTYDNQVLVPLEYDFACMAPNDDGQTVFGNEGDYKVFDREGNEIFRMDKPIKAVSEGVVLWVQTDADLTYNFGYVKLDGTVLYESDGEDVAGQAGAVGFNEGYAFSSNGYQSTEYRIAADGTTMDIFEARTVLRHPELLDEQPVSSTVEGSAYATEGNLYYPVGACYQGYYVDRGCDFFDDTRGQYYVYDAEGTEQYWLMLESVADYAGYSWWGDENLSWSLKGFYHNGNYCYSDKTKMAVSISSGDDGKAYLIDTAKLEKQDDGWTTQTILTDSAVLFEGDYIEISDSDYWPVQKDGKWGYIDRDGNVEQMFDLVTQFYNGKAMVMNDGYAFFIDENMNLGEWKITALSVSAHGEVFAVVTDEGEKCYVAEAFQ